MHDPVIVRALMREREIERYRASLRKPTLARRTRYWKRPVRTAMSLSVAFAAGWLAASIF